ncbi:hypothetical protein [Amycolatopsis sp. lyj-84]|uniref:hypothetical protein n=1 Tax=Amycolatopsis sp. lyj-84 TaxID=2789284 RepID=UPI00397B6CE4
MPESTRSEPSRAAEVIAHTPTRQAEVRRILDLVRKARAATEDTCLPPAFSPWTSIDAAKLLEAGASVEQAARWLHWGGRRRGERSSVPDRATGAGSAVHRTILVVDVEGFGDPRRTLPHQLSTRAGLYRVLEQALRAAGVRWTDCYHEDRGDGVLVLIPPESPKAPLVEVLPGALAQALRCRNAAVPLEQQTRLRIAVHAGEIAFDDHGATSTALITTFRLLDAAALKHALAGSPGTVALIVSRWIFDEVVRHSALLDAATFRSVPVAVKETQETAWIALPDHPYPHDPAALDQIADPGAARSSPTVAPANCPQLPPCSSATTSQ